MKSKFVTHHCSCAAVCLLGPDICGCTNWKKNDSQKRVDVNEIFNDDDNFGEFQDESTDKEADDSSNSSEEKLFDIDEIDND